MTVAKSIVRSVELADIVLKVMIVEDTALYRKILRDILNGMENVNVIDSALNGELALRKIAYNEPDLVLLDIEMPVLDGISTLVEIRNKYPKVGVIIVSGISKRQSSITMDALQKGAFDFIAKPNGNNIDSNIKDLKSKLAPVIEHFINKKYGVRRIKKTDDVIIKDEKKEISRQTTYEVRFQTEKSQDRIPTKFDVVLIGTSTGGPAALHKIIPLFPANLGVPILLVQHMPPVFTKSLAEHLNVNSELEVVEAAENDIVRPNCIYIAPGGYHMVVKKEAGVVRTALLSTPHVNSCRPSVDVLFESASDVYKENILCVIMTGMGADGLNGVQHLKSCTSCYSITQSEDSCTVYGMPRMVDMAGLSNESVHLDSLTKRITELVKNGLRVK